MLCCARIPSLMLVELRAENYAVIDHAIAVFGPGLNLLTGETGAGKSILLDALGLALGMRADSGLVRPGASQAMVTAEFDLAKQAETRARFPALVNRRLGVRADEAVPA